MATKDDDDRLSTGLAKILECHVCCDTLFLPKTLKCDHSFCRDCLANIVGSKLVCKDDDVLHIGNADLAICCPVCRKIDTDIKSIGGLKVNHYVTQMLDLFKTKSKEDVALCQCKNTAKFFCLRCKQRFCTTCCKNESKNVCQPSGGSLLDVVKKMHFIVSWHSGDNDILCKEHHMKLNYFCKSCKNVCCLDCIFLKHMEHEISKFESVKREAKAMSERLQSFNRLIATDYERVINDASTTLDNIEKTEQSFLTEFHRQQSKLQGLLSSVFQRAEKYFSDIFSFRKATLIQGILTTRNNLALDDTPNAESDDNLLVFQMKEMDQALSTCNETLEEMENLSQIASEKRSYNKPFSLKINDEEVYELVMELVSKFQIDPPVVGKFIPHDYSLKDYRLGKYETTERFVDAARSEVTKSSIKGRRVYDRDFLLRFQFYAERPDFPDDVCCCLKLPHFVMADRAGPSNAVYPVFKYGVRSSSLDDKLLVDTGTNSLEAFRLQGTSKRIITYSVLLNGGNQ